MHFKLITSWILCASVCFGGTSPRQQQCLNGTWQFAPGEIRQTEPDAKAVWKDFPVPSFWDRAEQFGVKPDWPADLACGWYRRDFSVNPEWKGKRIVIRFDAVRYTAKVFVNGKLVGTSEDGFLPFSFDITDIVSFDKPNQVLVKVENWRGLLAKDKKDIDLPVGREIVGLNAFLAPIGPTPRCGNMAGIWQDVWLEALPDIRIERVKVTTDVKEKKLGLRVELSGKAPEGFKIRYEVLDGGKNVFSVGPEAFAEGEKQVAWAKPHLWWPHDPYLYQLRTELIDPQGNVIDSNLTRFGFRQIGIRGSFIYLNGQRLNLRGDHWMALLDSAGSIALRPEYAKAYFEFCKRCNINVIRLSGSPMPTSMLDMADETGMLIIDESANYGSDWLLRMNDPVFMKRSLIHVEQWIKRDWNHPSVIVWSLGNEFGPPTSHSKALYKIAKTLDPTRIAYYDCGSEEFSDAVCPHYAWHWARSYQLPNTAYWFADAKMARQSLGHTRETIGKPCFMGEYLDAGSSSNSQSVSVFLGPGFDKAAKSERWSVHFKALRIVAEGARYSGVAHMAPFCLVPHTWIFCCPGGDVKPWPDPTAPGIKPVKAGSMVVNPDLVPGDRFVWANLFEYIKFAYSPMYAYCRDYSHTFYSRQSVKRQITCFNDDLRSIPKTVRWTAKAGERLIATGTRLIGSPIGNPDEFEISFQLPEVSVRTPGSITLMVMAGGEKAFENVIPITIFPKPQFAADASRVGFWHVSKEEQKKVNEFGLTGIDVSQAGNFGSVKVIIVGSNATNNSRYANSYASLAEFVRGGGCVIALPQTGQADWMPGRLKVDNGSNTWSTIGFLTGPEFAQGRLTSDDVKFWSPEHVIAKQSFLVRDLPTEANALVVAGSPMGIAHAPIVQYRYGKGLYLLCQMPVIDSLQTEGAAGTVLAELIRYGQSYQGTPVPVKERFTYRRTVEVELRPDQALPAKKPDDYRLNTLSEVFGCGYPMIDCIKQGRSVQWKIKNIPFGIRSMRLTMNLRTNDGGHVTKRQFTYRVLLNGKPVTMKKDYENVRMTFDSFQGWQIWMGNLSSEKPIKIRNGDTLQLIADQDWSAVTGITLSADG